jgi:hypothetical protein
MPENIEGDLNNDPEEQMKEISKWNISLISCAAQV